ncbi:MAG TPA: acyl-CoA thioesterase [Desulfosporosinus sp.]|nr:acyl-CoA thioesterase [Desulfosporosinus sp.]
MYLTDYPVQVSRSIAESEMGDAGHVKNTYFVRYFECARIQYLQRIGLNVLMTKTGIGVIVAQTICKYLKPLVYPDHITVGAKVKSTGKSSFVLEYSIVSVKNGLSATGEEVIVIYDYNNAKKTYLPLVIKEEIERIERKPRLDSEIS